MQEAPSSQERTQRQEPTTRVTGAPAPPRPPRLKAWLLVLLTLVFSGAGFVSLQWAAQRKIGEDYSFPHVTIEVQAQSPIRPGENVELVAHATGRNLFYFWDFGDQSTGRGPQVQHYYLQSGTYQVTVTVTDAVGQRSSSSVQVQVLPCPLSQGPTSPTAPSWAASNSMPASHRPIPLPAFRNMTGTSATEIQRAAG
jgi:chitodextrinase